MATPSPSRGEVWFVDLDPTRGHEQGGRRPALVVSDDGLNRGPAGIVIVVPITGVDKKIPLHVRMEPPEGGLTKASFAKPEDVRSVSKDRLIRRAGAASAGTMAEVADRLRVVMAL